VKTNNGVTGYWTNTRPCAGSANCPCPVPGD